MPFSFVRFGGHVCKSPGHAGKTILWSILIIIIIIWVLIYRPAKSPGISGSLQKWGVISRSPGIAKKTPGIEVN